MYKFTLKAPDFRRLPDPVKKDSMQSRYICYVQAKSIPEKIDEWFGTNPREQKMTTDVARKIKESLRENENFHELNRGVVISAESAKWDNKTSDLEVVFEDPDVHGNIDGGHTLRAVLDAKLSNTLPANRYVLFEIFTGIGSPVELAAARNTSVQVDLKSLQELEKNFDPLKRALENTQFTERIQYKMNEHYSTDPKVNTIDVREVISILLMFCQEVYPYKVGGSLSSSQPLQCYSGKEASLRKFLYSVGESSDPSTQKANREKMLKNISAITKDIFALWEKIETTFPEYAGKANKRYGARSYSKYDNGNFVGKSLFGESDLTHIVPKGLLYPLVSAFRALVQTNEDGTYFWKKAPLDVWEEIGTKLVNIILDERPDNPDVIAKNANVWSNLFKEVYIHAYL
jgi:hypothetical protein